MLVGWSPPKDRHSRQAGTDLEELDFHKVVIVAGELAHRDEAIGLEVHALAPAATRPAGLLAAVRHRADRNEFAATLSSSRFNDKIDERPRTLNICTRSCSNKHTHLNLALSHTRHLVSHKPGLATRVSGD
jgi:hypothetical protein